MGTDFSSSFTGLNKTLVDTCVEYLNQPLAKKEEGIFRVSGDSSIIKSLHSQFMTHDQDTEQVMCVVCICDRILENNKINVFGQICIITGF